MSRRNGERHLIEAVRKLCSGHRAPTLAHDQSVLCAHRAGGGGVVVRITLREIAMSSDSGERANERITRSINCYVIVYFPVA
jgi:hypothetical protein